jgi:hypothetical protein
LVNGDRGTKRITRSESVERLVYGRDPLAWLLMDRLHVRPYTAALLALGWSAVYLFLLPAFFGSLRSRGGYLGSLDDWHAQLLLVLVFPATCAFYVWQPRAVASVYEAVGLDMGAPGAGSTYRSRLWPCLSIVAALAVVLFDGPKMVASYGSWWMTQNWLTILGREASLAAAFYILSMMAWRQFVSTVEWRRSLASPPSVMGLKAASSYQLSWALLLALLGLRLSVEAIELPQRAGTITPDYYVKVAVYVAGSVLCFFTPIWGALRNEDGILPGQYLVWLELAGIVALPLLGFVVLKLVLGP